MEPYGEVGVLVNLSSDSSGGDILKSLLTSHKMQKSEQVEVNILQDLETRTQPEEPLVFQIELGQPIKSEFISDRENIIQHIPVTYLTADGPNLTSTSNGTLVEPITYVLSRDVLSDPGGYCAVGSEDPQKVFLLHEIDPSVPETLYGNPEKKACAAKESQTGECRYIGGWSGDHGVEARSLPEPKHEGNGEEKKKKKRTGKSPGGGLGKPGKRHAKEEEEEEEAFGCRGKSERKFLTGKKPLNKRKSGKIKGKVRGSGKGFPAKPPARKQPPEEKGEETERRNLFELTRLEDNVEEVARRLKIGCECSDSNCFDGLNPGEVFKHRLNIADLTKAEHDMYLMGVIMASIHNLEETCRHKERIRIRSCYAYQGKKVCLTAFLYLQHVTLYQMKRLRSHLKNHGVSPRIHGNCGRKPANTFSLDIYRRATDFVREYIEENCARGGSNVTSGPGVEPEGGKKEKKRKSGSKTTSYHLPAECTKRILHGEYKSFCESSKPCQKVMKYSTFTNFLKKQFPNVKFHKREEKKQEKTAGETERWRRDKWEEGERKPKEDRGVDKSIQVDKALAYVPAKD